METPAEEIARLRREIGERQARLQFLVLGDPRVGVSFPVEPPLFIEGYFTDRIKAGDVPSKPDTND